MAARIFYFDIYYAVKVHAWIIEKSGGMSGNCRLELIESALQHIQNDLYYPEFHQKLTHLVFSINKFHAFVDGNKRSSIALGAYFLQLNGYGFMVRKFVFEMENIAVLVAESKIDKNLLGDLIEAMIFEDDYSESLKLRYTIAIMKED